MMITSRYGDQVRIDPEKIPTEFRHLLPLAKEWSIGDDAELDAYIDAATSQKKRELVDAFVSHFDALWQWHVRCEHLVPQPDELVLFDAAANAAATVTRLAGGDQKT